MSLSKNQIKLLISLQQKKFRLKHELFLIEGVKVVHEFLASNWEVTELFHTSEYLSEHTKSTLISPSELKKISSFKNPNKVIATVRVPKTKTPAKQGLTVCLDAINDPGNLGTIIRLCDWFGVAQIICSKDTVDVFNPKTIQASMGSITRISIIYMDLLNYLNSSSLPKFKADLNGSNIHHSTLPEEAIVIMGNEANGLSDTIKKSIDNSITIPQFGIKKETESLNVATATAIILNEFRRS